jgi:integrase
LQKNTHKLSQKFVDQLPYAENGKSRIYFDNVLKGFGVSVGKTVKSYILQREVNRKSVRVTIGRSTEISTARARENARDLLHAMRGGKNPNVERKAAITAEQKRRAVTLRKVLNSHVQSLKIKGNKHAIKTYPEILEFHAADWLDMPVVMLTRDKVIEKHRKIGEKSPAMANKTFRVIRSLLNQYRIEHPNYLNPVEILSLKKLWFDEKPRDTRIKPHELKKWMEIVLSEVPNPIHQDYLLFLLFNGLRRNEAMKLKWEQVDFASKSFRIEDTKNKKPLELPMTDVTEQILRRLWRVRDVTNNHTSQWVFPSEKSSLGRLREPKKSLALVNEHLNMNIRFHDLRRTFVSTANSIKISPYTIKKLVNHSVGNDVTAAVYNVMDVDDLREPMQQIADHFKKLMEVQNNNDETVTLGRRPLCV